MPISQRTHARAYTSGRIAIYEDKNEKLSSFSAKINVTSVSELHHVITLDFSYMTFRDRDQEFMESFGRRATAKIRTPSPPKGYDLNAGYVAVIEGWLYGIIYTDEIIQYNESVFYIDKIRKLEP